MFAHSRALQGIPAPSLEVPRAFDIEEAIGIARADSPFTSRGRVCRLALDQALEAHISFVSALRGMITVAVP